MTDYAAVYSSLYTIGSTAPGVLALVNSVFPSKQLGNTAGKVLPWLVWTYDAVSGERGEMSDLHAAWWVYIAPNGDVGILYDVAAALDVAYINDLGINYGRIRMGKPGKPFIDQSLNNLQGIRIPLSYRTLG